jgi:O-antigen/teichoic acid export membrane protein
MSQAADLAKTSTKAGFNYLWGLVISSVISSIGTIYVTNLLGSTAYGLYSMAFTVPTLIMLFRDWGVNSAMVRYTAQYRAENRGPEIRNIFLAGIAFELVLGIILFVTSFLLSDFLANNWYNLPEIAPLIRIASIAIIAGGLIASATSVFTGTEETTYHSILLICQSIIKTVLIVLLIYLGLETTGAVTGFALSSMIAGLIGLTFIAILYKKQPKTLSPKLEIKEYTKEMLKYGIPISILTIVSGFLLQFYALILQRFTTDLSTFGNYAAAVNFIVLISFFTIPITSMLFPAFSKLDAKKHKTALKNVFQYSVKYSSLLVVPVATLVMCLSTQAANTLYQSFDLIPLFLTLLAINHLFSAAGNLSISNLLNSQGQTKLNLKLTILTAAIGFPMGYFLIMNYNVLGLIFTSTVAPIPSLIISLFWIKKHYNLTIDWTFSAKILTTSAITAALTYLLVNLINLNTNFGALSFINIDSAIELIIGTAFYVTLLLIILILTKTLSITDLKRLHKMTTGLGPISKVIHLILKLMEKIMTKCKLA